MIAVKLTLLLGLCFGLAQGEASPNKMNNEQNNRCEPSADCIANEGYCINIRNGETCPGALFFNECRSSHCSCCVVGGIKDECARGEDTCPTNSVCQDIEIGFECLCGEGFEKCGDVNECLDEPCGENSECFNTYGSYECRCLEGYQKINGTCEDIDECTNELICAKYSTCQNNIGSYDCICDEGFEKVNGFCKDINECSENPCPENSDCENNLGSYSCTCREGFDSDDGDCIDIDECLTAECGELEECVNTEGSFACKCRVCAERCPLPNSIYFDAYTSCVFKINGNFTNSQTYTACKSESAYLLELDSVSTMNAIGTEFWSMEEGKIWLFSGPRSVLEYTQDDCLALTRDPAGFTIEITPCDDVLKAAFCSISGRW